MQRFKFYSKPLRGNKLFLDKKLQQTKLIIRHLYEMKQTNFQTAHNHETLVCDRVI